MSSCLVFITKGPYAAIGSRIGSPERIRMVASSMQARVNVSPSLLNSPNSLVARFCSSFTVMLHAITRIPVLFLSLKEKVADPPAFNFTLKA